MYSCTLGRSKVGIMWVTAVVTSLFFYLVFKFFGNLFKRPTFYPPGPPLLPILGNFVSLWFSLKTLKYHYKVWQSWSTQYGNILGLKFGTLNIVIVSGRSFIKEVSSRDVFDGRPDGFFYTLRSFGKKLGIVFSDGPSWFSTRRVVLKYLKNFGYGTGFMEKFIAEECRALMHRLTSQSGAPVLVNNLFNLTIVNILWQIVAGKRYDLNDIRLKKICNLVAQSFQVVDMSGGLLNCMPFLRHIVPNFIGYTKLIKLHKSLHEFLRETIQEHERSVNVNNPRDVIDAFLVERIEMKNGAFSDEELQVVCRDLLEAGMETVSNTATFMLLYLSITEKAQRLVQEEIEKVIGQIRSPTCKDRTSMPYSEAVILETLRMSSVAPVGIPHMALENAQLGNFVIPKGTFILLAIHDLHNGVYWNDPDVFKPERFLTNDGKIIQDDKLLPFGYGKRRCIGEGLARAELFMLLTHILQKFHLKIPVGDPLPSTKPVEGVTLSPKPFRIIFERRF